MVDLVLTTELDAVNLCLAQIGEAPVNTLENSTSVDVANAIRRLSKVNREVQAAGWDFNTDEEYSLARNNDDEVDVPSNALRIDTSRSWRPWLKITQRNGKLYNKTDHTFTFDEDPDVDIIWLLDFETLPEAARNYIAIRAAREFAKYSVTSQVLDALGSEDEGKALALLQSAESDDGDYNLLRDNPDTATVLLRDYVPPVI